MTIEEAKAYLIKRHKPEYQRYITNRLAGNLAVALAKDCEELKSINKSLKISLAEQGRVVDKVIDELFDLRGGRG